MGGILVSKVANKLKKIVDTRERRYRRIKSSETVYEVQSKETLAEYIVDVEKHTGRCHVWQTTGYLCGHACTVILGRREDPQAYAKPFFTLLAYRKTNAIPISRPHTIDFSEPVEFDDDVNDGTDMTSAISDDYLSDIGNPPMPPNTRRVDQRKAEFDLRRKTTIQTVRSDAVVVRLLVIRGEYVEKRLK
jgi:hypothetical protein